MFQFLRRVSGSLLPRPDRPWREDATSNAPTIGRKRRYSLTESDINDAPSATKRTRNDLVKPDAECDTGSEGESTKGDALSPVERRDVKEVTNGVRVVDLEDKDKAEDPLSILPEGIPLPDSPSASPEPESEPPELAASDVLEEAEREEHPGCEDSIASSLPQEDRDEAEEGAEESGRTEAASVKANADTPADETTQAAVVVVATVESGLRDAPETLEVKE